VLVAFGGRTNAVSVNGHWIAGTLTPLAGGTPNGVSQREYQLQHHTCPMVKDAHSTQSQQLARGSPTNGCFAMGSGRRSCAATSMGGR